MSAPKPTHAICVACSTAVPVAWVWRRWDEEAVCLSCVLDAADAAFPEPDPDGVMEALTHAAFHRGLYIPWCGLCRGATGNGEVYA